MDEPIAIIGLDARFPGDGDTAERFYESLVAGRSARTEVPADRYNAEAFWHPDAERSGSTRAQHGHYLRGSISTFDAPFFSITPAEARGMDPQQRGMLESVYKALENAGLALPKIAGSQTGVYVGCFTADYNDITVKDLDLPSKYAATGTVASMLSNRVSWFYDFRGPSITIDTACSSSLVAAHEACMSLKLREISMAIVGGCNLILTPEMTLKLGAAGVLGPDGKSYSFDHRGNGYARGEGFGVLVLKRVSDAIRDGDIIRAIIRNSSTNSDGRSPGITQPTKAAQAQLIKHVYSRAGLDPSITRYFEAHGTGTPVGDPIEASAISEVFTAHRSPEEPLYVGALKSNVGHLEGAAGVAAIIKGVFTLESGIIPPNIWFEKPNPKIQDSWHLKFPTEATAWPQPGLRRMSINSFGIGGSNAHVVMDDVFHFLQKYHLVAKHRTIAAPRATCLPTPPATPPYLSGIPDSFHRRSDSGISIGQGAFDNPETDRLFVLSSHDEDGVLRARDTYIEYLSSRLAKAELKLEEGLFLEDLSYTLASKRTHHAWRSFSIAKSQTGLQTSFNQMQKPTRAKSEPRLAFLFTGQGAQWPAMGMELMAYPAFQQSLLDADQYLNELGCSWSLTFELSKAGDASRIDDPEFCQPICTALQIALVDLLNTWKVYPHSITGHSSGEVAAAYAAGAISRQTAWKVAYYRGKLSAKLCDSSARTKTTMAAVGLDLDATKASIDRINQRGGEGALEVACMNSWQSHTVSGDAGKIDALVEMLSSEKTFARKLNVKIAYHSKYMKAMTEEYLELMGDLEPGTLKAPFRPQFWSSVYGADLPDSKLQDADYWVQNLISPVRFCESVTLLLKGSDETKLNGSNGNNRATTTPITDVLEIGPHSALKGPFLNIAKQAKRDTVEYHSILRRKNSGVDTTLEMAGSLFCRGHSVDLQAVNDSGKSSGYKPLMLIDLPGYAFNHSKEYWAESNRSKNFRLRPVGRHELLGAPVLDWNKDNAVWRNYIRVSENPWIEDHKVSGDVLYPAAGMLVMAIEASRQIADKSKVLKGFKFKDVSFHLALQVPDDAQGIESQFCLRPYRETSLPVASLWNEFQLFTSDNGEWREHCHGFVQLEYETERMSVGESWEDDMAQSLCAQEIKDAQTICLDQVATEKLYSSFRDSGLDFGPTFQTMSDIHLGTNLSVLATVTSSTPAIKQLMPYKHIQSHLIHPATLDGIVHANLVPLVLASKGSQHARVPVYANELWVSANPQVSHESYRVLSQARINGQHEAESSVKAVQTETGQLSVYASGLIFKALPSSNDSQHTSTSSIHGAFNIDWKPDPTLLTADQASQVFGLPMVADEDPSDWMKDCEVLCLQYIHRYLVSVSEEGSTKNLDWHHKRYVSWMEHVTSTSQVLTDLDITALEEKVTARGTPEGRLIIAVGQALPEMLGGPRDPLDVIFKDKIAENVYRHGLGSKRCYVQLCNYIDALVHKNPDMEILEIGAGTGGATRPVMETLTQHGKRYQHYDFTDISPSFFEHARETFSDQRGDMSFKILNVENNPLEQGFAAGQYDLIVAANVLHATKKIDSSLANVRTLLKPGGKLLLFEITNPTVLLGTFCFGVLPGWWLSEDADRIWGPLMSAENWRIHLSQSGFTGLDAVFQDFPGSAYQMSSILVSTVRRSDVTTQMEHPIYVLVDDRSQFQKDTAEGLSTVLSQHATCEIRPINCIKDFDIANSTCVVLPELEAPILQNMSEEIFNSIKQIVCQSRTLLWLTRGGSQTVAAPDLELVTGLGRVARAEKQDFKFVTLSFDEQEAPEVIVKKCLQTLHSIETETENSFRVSGDLAHIPRLVKAKYLTDHIQAQTGELGVKELPIKQHATRPLSLRVANSGQLDKLEFEDDIVYESVLGDREVEFQTMACGINTRDLASVSGKIKESILGLEASGIVTRVGPSSEFQIGDRVFGLSLSGTIRTHVRSMDGLLAKMPPSMSWNEASCIPVAFTTAYGVLYETGTIGRGDTILIHSAAGGIGQASLLLSQLAGAEVFATVQGSEQRSFLEATYGIPADHIFSNQDLSFRKGIQRMTSGRGVDIILNTLNGEALGASWDCIAPFGRFVELSPDGVDSHSRISLGKFRRNVRFESFDLGFQALYDSQRTKTYFGHMAELILNGDKLQRWQTPIAAYPFSRAKDAFTDLKVGNLVGPMVLVPHDEDVISVVPSQKPTAHFHSDATYVIAGGLGGLGRSVARWMASRGAKNLILLSRQGPIQQAAKDLIRDLEAVCDKVATPLCDVTDSEVLKTTIEDCLSWMPPIKGCIQGSMVLRDNRLEDMSFDEWNYAVRSKVNTSWNLCNVLGRSMDFFVLLSSTVGITGNAEQANYAAGNTFQDALARHLASQGVHTVSLDLPVISGVGFVAEKPELMDYMRSTGWSFIDEGEFHAVLDYHCHPRQTPLSLVRSQVIPRFWLPQATAVEAYQLPSWRQDPLFSHLSQKQPTSTGNAAVKKDLNHATLLAAATSGEAAEKIVLDALLLKLSRVLSVEVSNLDPAKPLHSYGVDSLVAVELRSWLFKELGSEVSVFDITNKSSVYQLSSTATEKSKLTPKFSETL
ncbi:Fc.00g073680.m01.CDS01 [Cosmosporella sp. VM-42]